MFGCYFHAITCHAPDIYRIVTLRSINTESQERFFGQAKMITKSTSSYHPDHIVENIMVRIQAEAKLTSGKAYIKEDSEISQLAKIYWKVVLTQSFPWPQL